MKILRNYILRDFFSSFIFALLSITMVMVMGNLVKFSDMVIRKGVPIQEAFKVFLYITPYLLGFTIPLALLLAVLLSLGRLISDNELVAINMAGLSLARILHIFLILGIIFSLFIFVLNDRIIPDFHYRYRTQLKNISLENISKIIEPGVFMEQFENFILYVEDMENNKLNNVFIYEISEERLSQVTFAKKGEFVIDHNILKMKLEDGFRDEISNSNKKELFRLNFKLLFIDIPLKNQAKVNPEKKASDMSLSELQRKIIHLKGLNIFPKELVQEMHKRISFSFSPLTFILLGFGISTIVRHREKSINFGIAALCALGYYLLYLLGEFLAQTDFISPFLGMWLPNIVGILIGLFLMRNVHFK